MGEPINPEAWHWYYELVGKGQCHLSDTYWQTETGGHLVCKNVPYYFDHVEHNMRIALADVIDDT